MKRILLSFGIMKFAMFRFSLIFIISLTYQGIIVNELFSSPDNTMSIIPAATDATTITASDENTRNSAVSTTYNAHSHTDISQVANTLNVGNAAAGNKTITAYNADSNKPFLRYDDTYNRWTVSQDGTNVSTMVTLTGASVDYFMIPDSMVQGDIIYHNGTALARLATGTSGYFLKTQGASANPVWAAVNDMNYSDTRFFTGSFTRDISTATGTQAVTGVGFTPKAIFFWGGVSQSTKVSWGAGSSTGTSQQGVLADDSVTTADTYQTQTNRVVFLIQTGGSTDSYAGTIQSFDSDGFTISWVKSGSSTGTATINFIALR